MIKNLLVLLLVCLISAACLASPTEVQVVGEDDLPIGMTVHRYVDDEAGVACWVFLGVNKGGIDCLPHSQTNLGDKK